MGSVSYSKGSKGRDPFGTFSQFLPGIEGGRDDILDYLSRRGDNPYLASIASGQENLLGRLSRMSGQLDGLPDMLKRSALGSTDAGAVAAMQAAKAAGAGRGGLAFGGGGALAAATRAAQGAATQQGAALSQAIVQGQQAKAGFELQLGSLQANIADSLSKAKVAQSGLFEKRQGAELDARRQFLDILGKMSASSLSGLGGGVGKASSSFGATVLVPPGDSGGGKTEDN